MTLKLLFFSLFSFVFSHFFCGDHPESKIWAIRVSQSREAVTEFMPEK